MDRAMALLAKKGGVKRVDAGSKAPSVEVVEVVEGMDGAGGSGLKRPREDGASLLRRSSGKQRVEERPRGGMGKTLTITGLPRPELPPIIQPEHTLHVEVRPHERWGAGSSPPLQVFKAFNLPQDFAAYVDRSRGEIAERCLSRGGRFLSDLLHIVEAYRGDAMTQSKEDMEKELKVVKDRVVLLESKLFEAERREEETAKMSAGRLVVVSGLEKENGMLRAQVEDLTRESEALKLSGIEERRRIEGLEKVEGDVSRLEKEVDHYKAELDRSVADTANAIGVGYGRCLDRMVALGVDVNGHSFEDFCASLAMEAEGGEPQRDDISKAGDAP